MANLNSIDGSAFSFLLQENRNQIPELFFRSNMPDIAVAVSTLASTLEAEIPDTNLTGEERQNYIAEQVLKRYNEMKHEEKHELLFTAISSMANQLGTSISRTFQTLRTDVKPEVDSLKEQIDAEVQTIVEEEDGLDPEGKTIELDESLEVLEWDLHLNRLGGSDVIEEEFQELTDIQPTETPSDLELLARLDKLHISKLQIHPDTEQLIRDTLLAKCHNELDMADMDTVLKLITDPYEFAALKNTLIVQPVNSTNYSEHSGKIIAAIDKLWPALETAKHTALNISENLLEELHKNIDTVQKLVRCGGYALMVMRKHWKDALVLDTKVLNGDVLASMEEYKITNSDVAKHIKMLFTTRQQPLPYRGLTASAIAEDKEAVQKLYATYEAEHIADASKIKHRATAKAMRNVLETYLESAGPDRIGDLSIMDFKRLHQNDVNIAVNRLGTSVDMNLENLLYDFVLSTWYPGTMVEKANTYFGEEVVRQLENRDSLSEKELALIDTRVAAKIASEFLAQNIVVTK